MSLASVSFGHILKGMSASESAPEALSFRSLASRKIDVLFDKDFPFTQDTFDKRPLGSKWMLTSKGKQPVDARPSLGTDIQNAVSRDISLKDFTTFYRTLRRLAKGLGNLNKSGNAGLHLQFRPWRRRRHGRKRRTKMRHSEFETLHPLVTFLYFLLTIGFSMVFMHPLCLLISLAGGLCSLAVLSRHGFVGRLSLPAFFMISAALINPAFNHQGQTVLAYLPSGNPLTTESIVYGLAASFMLGSVLCFFSCLHAIMSSDKWLYLMGRISPSLALIFSMTLSFIPKLSRRLRTIRDAQHCLGAGADSGRIARMKHGLSLLSILITWSLESAIVTADSMKGRGYGLAGRTSFSLFRFDRRDAALGSIFLLLGFYCFIGALRGAFYASYFPSFCFSGASAYILSVFFAYALLCFFPAIFELWEVRKWNSFQPKR